MCKELVSGYGRRGLREGGGETVGNTLKGGGTEMREGKKRLKKRGQDRSRWVP